MTPVSVIKPCASQLKGFFLNDDDVCLLICRHSCNKLPVSLPVSIAARTKQPLATNVCRLLIGRHATIYTAGGGACRFDHRDHILVKCRCFWSVRPTV